MEALIGGLIGGFAVITYMLFRVNRVLLLESKGFRKDARAAQGQVEKLKNELEMQKKIASSSKVTPFPTHTSSVQKAKYDHLKGEYDLLKIEQHLTNELLFTIRSEVGKPENMSSSLAMKIKAYLTSVIGMEA